jgi:hypothetical protein
VAKKTGGQLNENTGKVETGKMPRGSVESYAVIKDRSHLKPWNWGKGK